MKLISEKISTLLYIGSDYIDYCFGCFLLQQPKSKKAATAEHAQEVLQK
jgi:hypothetical protein